MKELKVEDVLHFAFLFGLGGPGCSRQTQISQEVCFQRYFRLAMPQFMRGDVTLVLGHMYGRILRYRSGVTICQSSIDGVTLGKTLSRFTSENFANTSPTNEALDSKESLHPVGHLVTHPKRPSLHENVTSHSSTTLVSIVFFFV